MLIQLLIPPFHSFSLPSKMFPAMLIIDQRIILENLFKYSGELRGVL